jgi:hypothetical protein
MQRNINSLIGYRMEASDGEIGNIIEFYFDDETWFIRYMILKTGVWLSGRKILISTDSLKNTSWTTGLFSVNISKKQIVDSPDIDTDKPVYRSQEIELYAHYEWESDWGNQFYEGGSMGKSNPVPVLDREILSPAEKANIRSNDHLHLRRTAKSLNFQIHSIDGALGRLVDFVMDDQTWQILFLVAKTHDLPAPKKILIAIEHILKVEWDQNNIFLDLTLAYFECSKLYEESDFQPPK